MLFGATFQVVSAAYELSTVVTNVILNFEYINRNWVEEYILSIVFLVINGVVMGFVGLSIDALYPDRYSSNKLVNKVLGFGIGLLQMRVFAETIFATVARIKGTGEEKPTQKQDNTGRDHNVDELQPHIFDSEAASKEARRAKKLELGLLYAMFIQVVVRDIPLFILQANATIHYRKWKLIDIITVISTFVTLTHGTAAYVAKEDKTGLKILAFLFLVGQFAFRLSAILLLAMTKGLTILAFGLTIALFAILSTAKLRLASPSHRFVDQLPNAVIFFSFYTVFVIDGSKLTARYGSAIQALHNKKLVCLHLWRCLENVVAIVLAMTLPRYTDFGVSSNATVAAIGMTCAVINIVTGAVFHWASDCCAKHDSSTPDSNNNNNNAVYVDPTAEVPYYLRSQLID